MPDCCASHGRPLLKTVAKLSRPAEQRCPIAVTFDHCGTMSTSRGPLKSVRRKMHNRRATLLDCCASYGRPPLNNLFRPAARRCTTAEPRASTAVLKRYLISLPRCLRPKTVGKEQHNNPASRQSCCATLNHKKRLFDDFEKPERTLLSYWLTLKVSQ